MYRNIHGNKLGLCTCSNTFAINWYSVQMQCPKLICQPKAVNEIKKSPRFGIREIWTSSPWCLGKYPCLQYATLIVFASIIIKLTVDLKANGGKSMLTYYTLFTEVGQELLVWQNWRGNDDIQLFLCWA